jgi:hypothetical protein
MLLLRRRFPTNRQIGKWIIMNICPGGACPAELRGNMLIENVKCILGKLQRSDIED